jgi:hypothetical protein
LFSRLLQRVVAIRRDEALWVAVLAGWLLM